MTPADPPRTLRRAAVLDRASANAEMRTVELAFSSEEPVERPWGIEILGHAAGEVDLAWIGGGTAPLLLQHDTDDQIGVVESAVLGKDRKARAVVRLSRSDLGTDVLQDIADGIRCNVSVGYEVRAWDVTQKVGELPVYRATDWSPLEISIVSVPADLTVGVGRAADPAIAPPPSIPPTPKQEFRMEPEIQAPPAPQNADLAAAHEGKRQKEITDLAKLANVPEMGVDAILAGDSVELFRGKVLLARQGKQKPLGTPPAQLDLTPKETQRYSLMRAIRGMVEKDWSEAGFELDCSKEIAKRLGRDSNRNSFFVPLEIQGRSAPMDGQRALAADFATQGGFLVATNNQGFIQQLRNRAVVMKMGATVLSGLVGNLTVPKQVSPASAYWLGTENTATTTSQQTFGQMSLIPRNVAAYTEVSRQLILQSSPSADQLIMNDLAAVVALAVDLAAIYGTGVSGQPLGVVNTTGIGSVTGTSLNYPGLASFQSKVLTANALINPQAGGYVADTATAALLMGRNRFTNTDTPLWQDTMLEGKVAGFPAMSSNQMATGSMLFGDWSQVVIGEWGALELELNPYANFPAGIQGIRCFYTVDVGVRYAASFAYATSIT